MNDVKKEKTVPLTSVGADDGQSNQNTNSSITEDEENCKYDFKEMMKLQKELRKTLDPSYMKTVTMSELYDTAYLNKPAIIDGLLYPGTYLFVGAPKVGKSFLMAQLAYHVSTGKELWENEVRQGKVLYLALEDDYSRLQKRLYRMFGTDGTDNLYFSVSARNLNGGLFEQLEKFISENPDTRLIIIDTLQKVRESATEKYSYASDYEVIAQLKNFSDRYGICLLLVHHTRKQSSDDKFDMISGTNGLLGAADGAFLLQKEKRTSKTATLEISGRDQQDQKLFLTRNEDSLIWELEKVETELWREKPDPLLESIAEKVTTENPVWDGTVSELRDLLTLDITPNALGMKLNVTAGRLLNEYNILYESRRTHACRRIRFELQA